jgi:hypothetical protein
MQVLRSRSTNLKLDIRESHTILNTIMTIDFDFDFLIFLFPFAHLFFFLSFGTASYVFSRRLFGMKSSWLREAIQETNRSDYILYSSVTGWKKKIGELGEGTKSAQRCPRRATVYPSKTGAPGVAPPLATRG